MAELGNPDTEEQDTTPESLGEFLCDGPDGAAPGPLEWPDGAGIPPATEFHPNPIECPVEPEAAQVVTAVDLESWYTFFDCNNGYGKPCTAGKGITVVLSVGAESVVVGGRRIVPAPTEDDPFAVDLKPNAIRFNKSGVLEWELDLESIPDVSGYHELSGGTLTDDGNILFVGRVFFQKDGENALEMSTWLVSPDGVLIRHEDGGNPVGKWSGTSYKVAAPYAPGAAAVGSGGDESSSFPPVHFLSRWDTDGNVLFQRTYALPKVGQYTGLVDASYLALAAPSGCGFAIIASTVGPPYPIHILRTNSHGAPVARWIYYFDPVNLPASLFAGVAGSGLFVSVVREPALSVVGRTELLRLDSLSGAPSGVYAIPATPEQGTRLPTSAIGFPTGVVVEATSRWKSHDSVDGAPWVHIFPPSGCPVASYAFPGLEGTFGELVNGFSSVVRLGDGSFAAVDSTKTYEVFPGSTHLYFFELPAVQEIEEGLPGSTP